MGDIQETITENKTKGNIVKVLCMECNRSTNHIVLVSVDLDGYERYGDETYTNWEDYYQIIQCQGCDTISFRHLNWHSAGAYYDADTDEVESGAIERLYPKRDADSLKTKGFRNAPITLRRIYRETIEAFNNECFTLCADGLRSLVEGICADQSVTDGPVTVSAKGGGTQIVRKPSLEGKIAGLSEKGILTKTGAETLHEHRYLGNEAVHELAQPSNVELKLAIEIIEHTLEQLYEIPEKGIELKREMTRRKAKK